MATGIILTDSGKVNILKRAFLDTPNTNNVSDFKVGIAQTNLNVGSTDLTTPIPITGTETINDCSTTTNWTAGTSDTVTYQTDKYVFGAGALEINKIGTAVGTCYANASVTNLDFTDKDLWIPVYVSDTLYDNLKYTNSLHIRYGSDSTSYYTKTVNKINLTADSWNWINFSDSVASTGSPVTGSCDYLRVGFLASNASYVTGTTGFAFDKSYLAGTTDYIKTITASYPTVDETNLEAVVDCRLGANDAVGFNLDSLAIVNDDSIRKMIIQNNFNDESKSSTDEFVFRVKNRIV